MYVSWGRGNITDLAQGAGLGIALYSRIAVRVVNSNIVPFWSVGRAVKAIRTARLCTVPWSCAVTKYSIQDKNIYNFDKTGFQIRVISTVRVITGAERSNCPVLIQPGNRE
jgi:hypothetical protein